MTQPSRSGSSPVLPAVAGAVAAAVIVVGAWFALRAGGDDEVVATDETTTTERAVDTTSDTTSTTEADGSGDTSPTTSGRNTEDTTGGTTIDDVPPSDLPSGAPSTFVAVTSDTFELVRVDSISGEVIENLGGWGGSDGVEGPLQALQFVELAPDGTIYVDDCCEPAYGSSFILPPGSSFDPATSTRIQGYSPQVSPDGSRLAVNDQGSAITIADSSGSVLGSFGEPDYAGDVLVPLTWIDSSTLAVTSTTPDGVQELQILDVRDPSNPVIGSRRAAAGHRFIAADVRADGNILVVTVVDTGDETADVIAEIIDVSTGQVVVDFNLPDDAYDADYDASGRFVVVARSNGQLDWYGGGQRGTLATGFISADW